MDKLEKPLLLIRPTISPFLWTVAISAPKHQETCPQNLDILLGGMKADGSGSQPYAYFRNLKYYPARVPSTRLQLLTQ